MVTIAITSSKENQLQDYLNQENRLSELVEFVDINSNEDAAIVVQENAYIEIVPAWLAQAPPILFPSIELNKNNFLGAVFLHLYNFEKAKAYFQNDILNLYVTQFESIVEGWAFEAPKFIDTAKADYIFLNNMAVALHYANNLTAESIPQIESFYNAAFAKAPNEIWAAFTGKNYALFFIEIEQYKKAEALLRSLLSASGLPQPLVIELKESLTNTWIKQLKAPYDKDFLEKTKASLWECLAFYETIGATEKVGMLLLQAGLIAAYSHSFSEGINYINKALKIFETAEIPTFIGQAQYTKGNILKIWAQNDNPQFFKAATLAYQEALKIFTKETVPDLFADIHHHLGIVYAEIPDEAKKKSIWAAVSIASFKEALDFYNKVDYPYEFAIICNNFGNAFTKYPLAVRTNNYDKALDWYREALDIRNSERFPLERVHTLCNYLEASWFASNQTEFDKARYADMIEKAQEIKQLTKDSLYLQIARNHIEHLEKIMKDFQA